MGPWKCETCGEKFTRRAIKRGYTPKYCSRPCMAIGLRGPNAERPRASRHARGYDALHARRRAEWKIIVDTGEAHCTEPICLMPDRRIPPGARWDLAHNRETGEYRGPAHAKCNRSEAAHYKNRRATPIPPARWAL